MGFWNFIGLANKKDTDNLKNEIKELKTLINHGFNEKFKKNFNSLEENFRNQDQKLQTLNGLVENMNNNAIRKDELNETSNNVINNLKNLEENLKEQDKKLQIINDSVTSINNSAVSKDDLQGLSSNVIQNLKSLEELLGKLHSDLNNDINNKYTNAISDLEGTNVNISKIGELIYNEMSEVRELVSDKDKLTAINKGVNENINQIKSISNEINILEKMIRALWINDIADSLDK